MEAVAAGLIRLFARRAVCELELHTLCWIERVEKLLVHRVPRAEARDNAAILLLVVVTVSAGDQQANWGSMCRVGVIVQRAHLADVIDLVGTSSDLRDRRTDVERLAHGDCEMYVVHEATAIIGHAN